MRYCTFNEELLAVGSSCFNKTILLLGVVTGRLLILLQMIPCPFAMHILGDQYVLNGILDLGALIGY